MIEPPSHPDLKLLPHRIDWVSKHAPSRPLARYPKDPHNSSAGLETITYRDFAVAIDRAAWWLKTSLEDHESLFAYCGPPDLLWSALLVAGIKTGNMMIHASPWTRPQALLEMLNNYGCSTLLMNEDNSNNAMVDVQSTGSNSTTSTFRSLAIPSMSKWFDKKEAAGPTFKYEETWDEAADKHVTAFHTSGSTGTPDLVFWTNRRIASWHSMLDLAKKDPSVLVPDVMGKAVFSAFMPAHVDGHSFQLFVPVYFGNTVVLRHPHQPLNHETIQQVMRQARCSTIIAPSGVIADLCKSPRTLALLRSLETIIVCGTGLTEDCHDLLRHPGLKIQTLYGRAEAFPCVQKRELACDSRYISFHETSEVECRPHSDELVELVVRRNDKPKNNRTHTGTRFRGNKYKTGDLFSRHPTIPDRWMFEGCVDDTIFLTNGEEIRVGDMERIIATHMAVKSALVYGGSRAQPLLVIEPWSDAMNSLQDDRLRDEFLDDVWPFVEEANSTCSGVGQLRRELTLIMKSPLVRKRNGSIDRMSTMDFIEENVGELYRAFQRPKSEETRAKPTQKVRSRGDEIRENLGRLQAFREANVLQW